MYYVELAFHQFKFTIILRTYACNASVEDYSHYIIRIKIFREKTNTHLNIEVNKALLFRTIYR